MTRLIRNAIIVLLGYALLSTVGGVAAEAKEGVPSAKKLHVVVLTGGHAFNERDFLKLFQGYKDIAYKHLSQKIGGEVFEDIADWPYDVIVLYNLNQHMTPKQQKNFLALLDKGVGLVILHHAIAAYDSWPLFAKISGVKYHLNPWEENGVKKEPSGWKEGVEIKVHVADPNHPITRGLKDYDLFDETYCRFDVDPGVHALLTTDAPTSDKTIAWVKTYGNARVFFIQSGHDHTGYDNPNYRKIVVRAIRWTAGKSP
jgi:type 1 glutamine amidotransferase